MLSELATLPQIQTELKKRTLFRYERIDSNFTIPPRALDFIKEILYFEDVLNEISIHFGNQKPFEQYQQLALNRWYHFWFKQALKKIFASFSKKAVFNVENDFIQLKSIPFQLFAITFPTKCPLIWNDAYAHPKLFAEWLFQTYCSTHLKQATNILFFVLYDKNGAHWKLKAEINPIRQVVQAYYHHFKISHLHSLYLPSNNRILVDIIWLINPPFVENSLKKNLFSE